MLTWLAPVLLAHASSAQQFSLGQVLAGQTDGAWSIHAADLDGDGDPDAISASLFDNKLAWYENRGGRFGPQSVISTAAAAPVSVFAADLDGDGDQDVLSSGLLAWYENTDGRGTFGPQQIIGAGPGSATSAIPTDVDGDGDQDVLACSFSLLAIDGRIFWHENTDGLGTFGPQRIVSTAVAFPQAVFAADIDGDGDQDALSASAALPSIPFAQRGEIAWYENTDGLGGFGPQQVVSSVLEARSVFAADLDGDGDQDVLTSWTFDSKLVWYENIDGLGGFGPEQLVSPGASWTVFAADLDGDGDQDILSPHAWYENADGLGSSWPQHDVPGSAQSVFAADVDEDGDADVLTASPNDVIAWSENTDGLGSFGPKQLIAAPAEGAESVFAADLDGDGDKDVLSASALDDKVAWYRNADGLGSFGPQQLVTSAANGASSVSTADMDGDGDEDVLSTSASDYQTAWYENTDGLGSFGPAQVISNPADAVNLAFSVDLDGDGDQDVLGGAPFFDEASWYENIDGRGSFGPRQVISASTDDLSSLFPADMDGDGDQDVLADAYLAGEISWYENIDGRGGFGPQKVLSDAADRAGRLFAADLDGDADQDVLLASFPVFVVGMISWYENTDGAGSLGPQQIISVAAKSPYSLFAADLDGDGDQDVLSASTGDDKIAWYENTDGSGSFGPQQIITVSAKGADSVFAADMDGDGDHDALSASYGDDEIAWYENELCCSLDVDAAGLSLTSGGTQVCELDAGTHSAGHLYWILSTSAGASPGLSLAPPPLKLPLNSSPLLRRSALEPNLLIVHSLGLLDGAGKATATLTLPAGSDPSLAGATLHHAYLVLEPRTRAVTGVSNAVLLQLVP